MGVFWPHRGGGSPWTSAGGTQQGPRAWIWFRRRVRETSHSQVKLPLLFPFSRNKFFEIEFNSMVVVFKATAKKFVAWDERKVIEFSWEISENKVSLLSPYLFGTSTDVHVFIWVQFSTTFNLRKKFSTSNCITAYRMKCYLAWNYFCWSLVGSDTLPNIHSNFEIPSELDESGSQIILQLCRWVVVDSGYFKRNAFHVGNFWSTALLGCRVSLDVLWRIVKIIVYFCWQAFWRPTFK